MSFDVDARKVYADGAGRETDAPMAEPVELGVFTRTRSRGHKSVQGRPTCSVLERRRIESGRLLRTSLRPSTVRRQWVGIDSYNKRIDRNPDDNLAQVAID